MEEYNREQDEKRKQISKKYIDGHYEECMAMVMDQLLAKADQFVTSGKSTFNSNSNKSGSMMGLGSFKATQTVLARDRPGQTRLMNEYKRDADSESIDLLIFYITLLHLTGDTDDIKMKLEAVQIHEPEIRLPFKAFLAWVQLEMYLGRLAEAQNLINGYIKASSHLADPPKLKPLGSQLITEEAEQSNEAEDAGKGARRNLFGNAPSSSGLNFPSTIAGTPGLRPWQ